MSPRHEQLTLERHLRPGLVDDVPIALAPVFLGEGLRLFDRMAPVQLTIVEAQHSPRITPLRYSDHEARA